METVRPNGLFRPLAGKQDFWKRGRHWVLAIGVLLAGGSAMTSCSEYDLDERTPEGWGSSIYSWLDDQGNYTNTVRMINDLGQREVLAKTGSRTLFVADDAAYERFYRSNSWGVHSYDQLSLAQKKLLLYGSMMDNSMQLGSLSNVQGTPPREGEAMRRYASGTPYDSVMIMGVDQMPVNPYWRRHREAGQPIVCMTDNSKVPLVQFIEKQLTNKRITNEDYNFLYNFTTDRKPGDASINGVQVEEANIKCSNGFIHRMAEVVTPLPNMAELIRSKSNVSEYNRLLERFCAPYPDKNPDRDGSPTMLYNFNYGVQVDTVYQKRFFSDKSQNGEALLENPDGGAIPGKLKFDPEWNAYFAGLDDEGGNIALQRDMAVMMVPSNEALDEYWNKGAGKALKDYFGTWDNVRDDVIQELINVNMLSSFVGSVPSKFETILNDANDPMGVELSAIDSVWLACNGAVYLTNRVYSPIKYVSVMAPAVINESMNIFRWAVDWENLQYDVYLNSLNSYYSLFLPNNNALLQYVDPCSYGKENLQMLRFHYDDSKTENSQKVWVGVHDYDPETGEVGEEKERITDHGFVTNRLKDLIETHIVIGNVEDGHAFYRTKSGNEIRVKNVSQGANGMTVEGSYQMNEGAPVRVQTVYDQTDGGNGKVYVLNDEPIMTTRKTVHEVLGEHEEFSKFLELMEGSGLFEQQHLKRNASAEQNVSTFNTYHYTVYVPTNESITALQKAGKLSSWEAVAAFEEAGNLEAMRRDSAQIVNFIRYHIQDNALYIGAQEESGDYETAVVDPATERFYRVNATLTEGGITLRDHAGNTRHVVTSNPALYNLTTREYQYNTPSKEDATMIETASSAVVHLIDEPLLIQK